MEPLVELDVLGVVLDVELVELALELLELGEPLVVLVAVYSSTHLSDAGS